MNKKHLSLHQRLLVAATLFGMFFGAGNLIFLSILDSLQDEPAPGWRLYHCSCRNLFLGLQPLEIHILTGCRHLLPK
ncbi:MAG: hypothetical protein ACLRRJ_01265 [Clostridium sp.]